MKLRIQKLHPNAQVPEYSTEGAACFDLYAATVDGVDVGSVCHPGHSLIVGTGLAFEVPDGYMLAIRPRSGLAFKHGVQAFQGTIDSDYRGEVMILLEAASLDKYSETVKQFYYIKPGDRVAQAALVPVPRVAFEVCEQLTLSDRGGFGSTGA